MLINSYLILADSAMPHCSGWWSWRWFGFWWTFKSNGERQVQDLQCSIRGGSSEAISVDCSWQWIARVFEACCCWSPPACFQIFLETLWVCIHIFVKCFSSSPFFFILCFEFTIFLSFSLSCQRIQLLLPCYRPMIEGGKNPHKYIRYSPEDLDRMLNEFFEGKTWNEQKR